jgi:YD repeat-containing protein
LTYDANGNAKSVTATDTTTNSTPYSTNGNSRTWSYTCGANFLLASERGPRADVAQVTSYAYDSSGTLTKLTNALNQTTQVTQFLPGGLPQTILDANGVTRTLTYDARLRLLTASVTTSKGKLTSTMAYDAAGNLVSATKPGGSALTNKYDAANRVTEVTDLFGQKITATYNPAGGQTQTTMLNSAGAVMLKHSVVFDAAGHVLKDTGGAGQTTAFGYDANGGAVSLTDPLQRTTQRTFDALNRTAKATDSAGGITSFVYDAQGRTAGITDPNGNTTSYVLRRLRRPHCAGEPRYRDHGLSL